MLTLTDSASQAVHRFVSNSPSPEAGVRIAVVSGGCKGYEYKMSVEKSAGQADIVVEQGEARLFIDEDSLSLLDGTTLDFVDSLTGAGFKFENPNAGTKCDCGNSFSC